MRRQAEQLTDQWAARLPARQRRRLTSSEEAVPLERAVVGIHALLDHGRTPTQLAEALIAREQSTVRVGAAVLDHRVRHLLTAGRLDPGSYRLPPPHTRQQDWDHTSRLLHAAEVNHLATQPTHRLATQRQGLTRQQTSPDQRPAATRRLELLDAALARQLDRAALHLTTHPAGYLTALLGPRPTESAGAADWERHALAVEHYRHHRLGLPYGTPGAPPTAPATEQALGPPPPHPADRARYQQLAGLQATLGLGL